MASDSVYRRAGISLLEVLISIFILAVGIVSVLSLFTAGREIRARTAVISRAVSFADQMATMVEDWRQLSEWQVRDPAGVFQWANVSGAVRLPVVIDPYGLNQDALRLNPSGWDWANFADVKDAGGLAPWQNYFRRITLPTVPSAQNGTANDNTLRFEEVIALFSDADAVEYRLPASPKLPPENVFEFGRRKRGGDLSAALMIAREDWQSTAPAVGVRMQYWLLISHKQPRDYELKVQTPIAPRGSVRFDVPTLGNGLIELSLPPERRPDAEDSIRRGLQPGRWLLLTCWNGSGWVIHWTKMTSVTRDGSTPYRWLVVPEQAPEPASTWAPPSPPPAPLVLAFVFDSLMHVQELTSLAGEQLF